MIISFLGQEEIIDDNLFDTIGSTLSNFFKINDHINFMFYGIERCCKFDNTYMEFCWQNAYKLRLLHPGVGVKFTKIISAKENNRLKYVPKPFGQQRFDTYFSLPDTHIDYVHFILDQSDYVLYYLYNETAKKQKIKFKKDNCIDLTDNNTRERIRSFVDLLPGHYQQIYRNRINDVRISDIATDLGYSQSRIGQIYREIVRCIIKDFSCDIPDMPVNFAYNMFLAQLKDFGISESEQNLVLADWYKFPGCAKIEHIWRDDKGCLCIAYDDQRWYRYKI